MEEGSFISKNSCRKKLFIHIHSCPSPEQGSPNIVLLESAPFKYTVSNWGKEPEGGKESQDFFWGWDGVELSTSKLLLSTLPSFSCFSLSPPTLLPFSFMSLYSILSANAQRTKGKVLAGWRGSWTWKLLNPLLKSYYFYPHICARSPFALWPHSSHREHSYRRVVPAAGLRDPPQIGPILRQRTVLSCARQLLNSTDSFPAPVWGWPYGLTGGQEHLWGWLSITAGFLCLVLAP